ncbi:MAG: non-canonical purine NTP pyrophosphatase, partial [bacterium]
MISQLVLATRNQDKIIEIREALADLPIKILSVADFPAAPEVIEDGETLEANAIK